MAVSSVNLSCNPVENNKCSFRGKWERNENGTPYYKTNSGTVAGGVLAVPAGLLWLNSLSLPTTEEAAEKKVQDMGKGFKKWLPKENQKSFSESWEQSLKDSKDALKKTVEYNKFQKKMAVPYALIASGLTLGCGMLIDHLRNNKAKETADFVKQTGVKNAVIQGDKIAFSNKGRAYYDSNEGSKYGALLGAGCGILHSIMASNLLKGSEKAKGAIFEGIIFAIGGWIMGKIADSNNNNDARKHA